MLQKESGAWPPAESAKRRRVDPMGELADLGGILTQQEARHGRRAWEFLWTVRFHLHEDCQPAGMKG